MALCAACTCKNHPSNLIKKRKILYLRKVNWTFFIQIWEGNQLSGDPLSSPFPTTVCGLQAHARATRGPTKLAPRRNLSPPAAQAAAAAWTPPGYTMAGKSEVRPRGRGLRYRPLSVCAHASRPVQPSVGMGLPSRGEASPAPRRIRRRGAFLLRFTHSPFISSV